MASPTLPVSTAGAAGVVKCAARSQACLHETRHRLRYQQFRRRGVVDGKVVPVRFGEALQFRTTVYFPETMRDPDDFSLTPALEYEVERLIDSGRRDALAAGRTPTTTACAATRSASCGGGGWKSRCVSHAPPPPCCKTPSTATRRWMRIFSRAKAAWCKVPSRCWATTCIRARARPLPASPPMCWNTFG